MQDRNQIMFVIAHTNQEDSGLEFALCCRKLIKWEKSRNYQDKNFEATLVKPSDHVSMCIAASTSCEIIIGKPICLCKCKPRHGDSLEVLALRLQEISQEGEVQEVPGQKLRGDISQAWRAHLQGTSQL